MKFKLVIKEEAEKGFEPEFIKSGRKGFDPMFAENNKLYVLPEYLFSYMTNKSGNAWVFLEDIGTHVRIKSIDDYTLENIYGQTYKVYELI